MKRLSVLLGCYGDFPAYSLRAIQSVADEPAVKEGCEVHVGCNDCSAPTLESLRRLADEGMIDTLIESRPNINKDPMMRLLIGVTTTPYLLWMDDDSWLKPGWLGAFTRFMEENEPLDVAGAICVSWRWPEYDEFLRRRPWWRDDKHIPAEQQDRIIFPVGGLFLARTAFLREHNFPDRGMVKRVDDVLLGDLVNQAQARMIPFSPTLWQHIVINDGARRGGGEGEDGWRFDENATTPL